MTMKSNHTTGTATPMRFAIPTPRRSDAISGALRCAFEAPADERDFIMLLHHIDHADEMMRRI
ncbi:hypothetical protein [Sphingomonas sp. NFR15]|uniref:hypothetical protein n=1 Tax=Sphingomonas sp. NFR15 TaxID=1566282 RepID=UPI00089250AD|nr:hypothetical protein [Sphingomonas sp. NFR15]SDA20858.1 hypothetical protein SAMN03159340_01332 [Sphingomonas sp. NFR15]